MNTETPRSLTDEFCHCGRGRDHYEDAHRPGPDLMDGGVTAAAIEEEAGAVTCPCGAKGTHYPSPDYAKVVHIAPAPKELDDEDRLEQGVTNGRRVRRALDLPDDATVDEMVARIEEVNGRPAEQPRPLTPDAITDEMVERAWDRWTDLDPQDIHSMRLALTAALTEPPARPEGAEGIERLLAEAWETSIGKHHSDAETYERELADFLAERGVRVTGAES